VKLFYVQRLPKASTSGPRMFPLIIEPGQASAIASLFRSTRSCGEGLICRAFFSLKQER
jgi:hypothetical protein